MTTLVLLACTAALVPAGLRWLRVAQREHYAPGRVSLFAFRWWSITLNAVLAFTGIASVVVATGRPAAGLVGAGVGAFGPVGLRVRGVSSPLRWTARLRRLAGLSGLLAAAAVAIGAAAGAAVPVAVGVVLGLPLILDGALTALTPLEYRLSRVWVNRARERLSDVNPLRVAITGSYGKTTTKVFCSQLLGRRYRVVASPASFNNELGLSRTINEQLAPGTEVFVAEMGTYGPGELRELVTWIRPDVSVITGIGPVHLERFGSTEQIVSAKAEILEGAENVVLNVDVPELADLANQSDAPVVRCSSVDPNVDVYVGEEDGRVLIRGEEIGVLAEPPQFAGNLACATGVAVALDLLPDASWLETVEAPAHRRQLATAGRGFQIIDDTYNSNPAGARAAVRLLNGQAGRRVVVTPGMVELGSEQRKANREFARAAASVATDMLIVGRTNRRSLIEGTRDQEAAVILVRSREEAVEWARQNLGPGDIVLYENDLPDHYP